jgi:hypothetical protein
MTGLPAFSIHAKNWPQWSRPVDGRMTHGVQFAAAELDLAAMEPTGERPDDHRNIGIGGQPFLAAMEPAAGQPDDVALGERALNGDRAAMEPTGERPDNSSPQKWRPDRSGPVTGEHGAHPVSGL